MKTIIKIFSIAFLVIFLVSCDPAHDIVFTNNTNSVTKVKFKLNPKFKNYRLSESITGDSIVLNLKPKDTANLYFGIGVWNDKEIDQLCNSIISLEIENNDLKTVYKSKKTIKNILENNQEGFWWKTRIAIEVE
jgi:hypothetical protein